jgi:GNAT superfamily N-acetyltransferase
MRWRIRGATQADARRLAEINVAGWSTAYRGIMPDEYLDALRVPDRETVIAARLDASDRHGFFLAVDEKDTIGAYVAVGLACTDRAPTPPATGEVFALYADPKLRGTGAGHQVHEAGLAHLIGAGFRHSVLWALERNIASRKFYEAHGWRPDGCVTDYVVGDRPVSEVRYSTDLSQGRDQLIMT